MLDTIVKITYNQETRAERVRNKHSGIYFKHSGIFIVPYTHMKETTISYLDRGFSLGIRGEISSHLNTSPTKFNFKAGGRYT